MKKTPTILILLFLLLAMIACNDPKPVTDALHRAEALMNEHPDSALSILNAISPNEMGQNSTRAHYALLYTQAQDKNYIDETNDSLITVAVDYYRNTDDTRHKFLSYYYKGRVLANAENYLDATTCYMEAEQLADAVGDDYLVGLLYAELGRIYRLYYDYPKSLEAHQKAAECYERAGKIRHRNYMWLNLSDVCRNMEQYEDSERFLRMALESAKQESSKSLVKLCLGSLVMQYVEQNRMSVAKELFNELEPLIDEDYGSAYFMEQIAKIRLSEKDYLRAKQSIEKGWKRAENRIDSVGLYFSTAELLKSLGEEKAAYDELMKGVALQNDEAHQALRQPILTAQLEYLSEKLEFEAYKLRMRKFIHLLSTLFLLLLLGVSVYVFVQLFKKHKKESQKAINDLKNEKKKVEDEKGKIVSILQQLDEDKKSADQTIATLKEDICRKEKESNAKISDLVQKLGQGENTIGKLKEELVRKEKESDAEISGLIQKLGTGESTIEKLKQTIVQNEERSHAEISALLNKLEQGKKDASRSIADLKQKLKEKEEDNRRSMASLSEKMEAEKDAARKTVQELNGLLAQKEEARLGMEALVQKLENETKRNSEIVTYLREELKCQELEYRQNFDRLVEMFGTSIVTMGEIMLDFEDIKAPNTFVENTVKQWKKNYFIGSKALGNLERLVNEFHNGAMCHFREEVHFRNKDDYKLVCYLFAGVSIKVIAWLVSKSEAGIYQWRFRLRDKIESSDFKYKDLYLSLLSK